ncbi:MAG TPA: adenine-specific methyltransferase EcoRI family protein [Methanofastidiosum sp.]|nr:adenine-specific methyltransferase EcoRI family protein [Methanofastidiosum sp.]
MGNKNLCKAQKVKNDEFYTQLTDIEKELKHYSDHFKNKIVFCNCNDPEESNFWKYFELNFVKLGIKKLISTHYEKDKPSYKLEISGDINNDGVIDKLDIIKTPLKQNGDFRSEECIEILNQCDIVVTNPPFSLMKEYIPLMVNSGKKFLIIAPLNSITYQNIFPYIKNNKIWIGYTTPKIFTQPDKTTKAFGNIIWVTNIDIKKRHEKIILYKKYNELDYPKYDNYDAIEVSQTKNIPIDYDGHMGVPISFLCKHNPNQFEIIRFRIGNDNKDLKYGSTYPFQRIIIKHKQS